MTTELNKSINNWYYSYYKKNFFIAKDNNCSRIYLKLKKK